MHMDIFCITSSVQSATNVPMEVVDAVRAVIPEYMPLFLRYVFFFVFFLSSFGIWVTYRITNRISATDWLEEVAPDEPSWKTEDTVKIAPILAAHGVDLLDVSTGGADHRQRVKKGHQYQVPFAAAVKKEVVALNLLPIN